MDSARLRASGRVDGRLCRRFGTGRGRFSAAHRRRAGQVVVLLGAVAMTAAVAQPAAAAGWSIQPVPGPAHSNDTELNGVSCTSTSNCVAVGFRDVPGTDNPVPLIERWNGSTWSMQRTPAQTGSGWLSAVSCSSRTACVAVGLAYRDDSRTRPLAERWDGSAWSIEPTGNLGTAEALDSVSCASSASCVAVGYGRTSFAADWNGARWSAEDVHFGDPRGRPNALTGVSCAGGACAAVGWDNVGLCGRGGESFYDLPVLGFWSERWWSLRRQPDVGCSKGGDTPGGYSLNAVSCTSPLACTAVGDGIYRWDGSGWSIQPAPMGGDELGGVSCAATNACTAVGARVYTWNGLGWSSVAIAYPAYVEDPELTGVSCPSRVACVAVGSYIDPARGGSMLAESIGMRTTHFNPAWER